MVVSLCASASTASDNGAHMSQPISPPPASSAPRQAYSCLPFHSHTSQFVPSILLQPHLAVKSVENVNAGGTSMHIHTRTRLRAQAL